MVSKANACSQHWNPGFLFHIDKALTSLHWPSSGTRTSTTIFVSWKRNSGKELNKIKIDTFAKSHRFPTPTKVSRVENARTFIASQSKFRCEAAIISAAPAAKPPFYASREWNIISFKAILLKSCITKRRSERYWISNLEDDLLLLEHSRIENPIKSWKNFWMFTDWRVWENMSQVVWEPRMNTCSNCGYHSSWHFHGTLPL